MDDTVSFLPGALDEVQFAALRRDLASLDRISLNERLDLVLEHQRLRWHDGNGVLVEDYVSASTRIAGDPEIVLHLIAAEALLRREGGERIDLRDFARRFPEYAASIGRQFEVESAIDEPLDTPVLASPSALRSEREAVEVPGFEILGELGRGGMGVVYKARQVGLDRLVALKMILPRSLGSSHHRERFLLEARVVASLEHPNIVPIHAIGEHGDRVYFALGYVSGGTLAARLRGKAWPAEKAAALVATLADAVQHAHERGVIHRDLKPANVLLDDQDRPFITDFGLSRQVENVGLTGDGVVLGTPAYMSPEQATGQADRVGPPADVFGLGAILYQLLTGRAPYHGPAMDTTLRQAALGEKVPLAMLQPNLPRSLRLICERAMAPAVADRYASAAELELALRDFLRHRRRRVFQAIAASACFVFLLGAVAWATLAKPPHVQESPPKPEGKLDGTLTVSIIKKRPSGQRTYRIGEPGATPGATGDTIQLEVELDRPAYIYLIWVDHESLDGLYPWPRKGDDELSRPPPPQVPTRRLRTPSDKGEALPLQGDSGVETALLLARSTPLPDDVVLGKLLPRLPRVELGDDDQEVMVRGMVEDRYTRSLDLNRGRRGLGKQAQAIIEDPLERLMSSVKDHFEVIRAVRFAHRAARKD